MGRLSHGEGLKKPPGAQEGGYIHPCEELWKGLSSGSGAEVSLRSRECTNEGRNHCEHSGKAGLE